MQGGFLAILGVRCFYLVFWILDTEKDMQHNGKRGWRRKSGFCTAYNVLCKMLIVPLANSVNKNRPFNRNLDDFFEVCYNLFYKILR